MAWVTIGTVDLIEGSTTRGYVYLEYDDSNNNQARDCRLRIVPRSGHSFYVNFNNITVDGVNYGSQSGLTQNSGVFWTGAVSGGRNIEAHWTNPWYAGTKTPSITAYLPAGAVAPSGVSATLGTVTDLTIEVTATVASYGSPTTSTNLRAAVHKTSSTSSISIDSSTTSGALSHTATLSGSRTLFFQTIEIIPNEQFYYGASAYNDELSTRVIGGPVVTLPAYITTLSAEDLGSHTARITVSHGTEGSYYSVSTEYSLDNGATWTSVASDTFQVTISGTTTVLVKRTSNAGSTPVQTLTLTDYTDAKLYGAVNGTAEELVHLYGSVNGESKKLVKLYASVNGVSKKIFEDTSNQS